ncbi:hypothetical protein PR048_023309 [Dryococelus australis]|uniref:Uncharacterized protein n=1 Tax=Dryococelus australis TaxID=614101 RepID=A0ABQ9GTT3_9NEOP|nr:hypothetical protein PR048_023309 [Dryococelus australis]
MSRRSRKEWFLCRHAVRIFGSQPSNYLKLKRTHPYYYEVQRTLNITQRDFCFFVVMSDARQPLHMKKKFERKARLGDRNAAQTITVLHILFTARNSCFKCSERKTHT